MPWNSLPPDLRTPTIEMPGTETSASAPDGETQVFTRERLEPLQFESRRIGTGRQIDEAIASVLTRDGHHPADLERRARDRDRDAGQGASSTVPDGAVESTRRDALREC